MRELRARPPKLPRPRPLREEKPGACRSPAEPGCERCCTKSTAAVCIGKSGSPSPPGSGSPPWFNTAGVLQQGPCPADCKPCAVCTLRDEWEFSTLPMLGCDCTRRYTGIDPCFNPMSCGCFCGRIVGLLEACPHLHPAP